MSKVNVLYVSSVVLSSKVSWRRIFRLVDGGTFFYSELTLNFLVAGGNFF